MWPGKPLSWNSGEVYLVEGQGLACLTEWEVYLTAKQGGVRCYTRLTPDATHFPARFGINITVRCTLFFVFDYFYKYYGAL